MSRGLWRLGTPLLALGVSFVVVLIIGAASPSSPKHKSPAPPAMHGVGLTITARVQTGSPSPRSGKGNTSRSPQRPGKVPPAPPVHKTTGALPGGGTVSVLNAATLRPVVAGHLSANGSYHTRLPEGSYFFCLRPRGTWKAAASDLRAIASWFCTPRRVGQRPVTVTFLLVSSAASGAG